MAESCTLVFSKGYTEKCGAIKLLEVPPALHGILDGSIKTLEIKGDADEEAVLCTKDSTYVLRKVETSNTVLVVEPELKRKPEGEPVRRATKRLRRVYCSSDHTYELKPSAPRLAKLRAMLAQTALGAKAARTLAASSLSRRETLSSVPGPAASELGGASEEELSHRIQASAAELAIGLKDAGAVCVGTGDCVRWYLLKPKYAAEAMDLALAMFAAGRCDAGVSASTSSSSSAYDSLLVDVTKCHAAMEEDGFDDFPLFVVRHVLECHGHVVNQEGPITIQLRKRDVAVFRAKRLLEQSEAAAAAQNSGSGVSSRKPLLLAFSSFMQRWRSGLPFSCDAQSETEARAALLDEACEAGVTPAAGGQRDSGGEGDGGGSAPPPFKLSLDMLSGIVLPHLGAAGGNGGTVSLEPYAEGNLPADARERFAALFAKRRKWRLATLRPFLAGLVRADPAANEGSLLLRYTRVSTAISKDAATGKTKRTKLYSAR